MEEKYINPFKSQYDHWFEPYRDGDKSLDGNLLGLIENGLTENEASFFLSYTARKSSWVNMELRNSKKIEDQKKQLFAKGLRFALGKMPVYNNSIAYRMDSPSENEDEDGIVKKWFESKIGCVFRIPYFLSTSKDNWKNTAYTWRIKTLNEASKGRDIYNLTNNLMENEVLFLPNSVFRIDSVNNDHFELTEIDSDEEVDFELTGLYYKNK